MVLEVTVLFKGINYKEALLHEPLMLRLVANINIEFYYNMVRSENPACSDFASMGAPPAVSVVRGLLRPPKKC
jgi:hypothetical protein